MRAILLSACITFSCTQPRVTNTTPTNNSSEAKIVESIEFDLASPNGCSEAFYKLENLKRSYGETADYFYYRGFCLKESNPEKACGSFTSFLKLAPSDSRSTPAAQYIKAQDKKTYPTCIIPVVPPQIALMDEIKTKVASVGGCPSALSVLEEYKKKHGADADYFYYKAYCYSDSNPEKACSSYGSFLEVAPKDARASHARSYMSFHDAAAYKACDLSLIERATEEKPQRSAAEAMDEIITRLATPSGCSEALPLLEEYKKDYPKSSDYYYYKAFCYQNNNPDLACSLYNKFIVAAKGDGRVSVAKSYINAQDASTYPNCTLPY